jgi:hypothetical protein
MTRRLVAGLAALLLASLLVPTAARSGTIERPYPTLDRADFIFYPMNVHYDPAARERYFDYLKRFRVCLTNGYEVWTGDDLRQVKEAGCELFVYRWFEGYYAHEPITGNPAVKDTWAEVGNHPEWLINPNAPTAGNGATLPAYFFDWANPDMRSFFIERLVTTLDANGYDGVFFDYIGEWGLPAQISALWTLRHPEMTYNEASAVFLAELRAALGDRRIFGNAAYKADKAEGNTAFYGQVDYDTTESYGTSFTGGKDAVIYIQGKGMTAVKETYYRPWDGPGGNKDYMEGQLYGPMQHQTGTVEFFPIEYVQPAYEKTGDLVIVDGVQQPVYRRISDRAAIHYSYALGKLRNLSAYASDWASWEGDPSSFEPEDVYFTDLGQPLEGTYRELPDAVVRYFENGFVVVTRTNSTNTAFLPPTVGPIGSAAPVRFTPDPAMVPADATGLWDTYADAAVSGWTPSAATVSITPVLYEATGSYYPSGRVYMYTR